MGKSYTIKYIAEMTQDKEKRSVIYEMRFQDILMRYANYNNGVKAGDTIKVWEQVGYKNYLIHVKKAIPKPEQDSGYRYIRLSEGIDWRNQWYVSRKYYSIEEVGVEAVSY